MIERKQVSAQGALEYEDCGIRSSGLLRSVTDRSVKGCIGGYTFEFPIPEGISDLGLDRMYSYIFHVMRPWAGKHKARGEPGEGLEAIREGGSKVGSRSNSFKYFVRFTGKLK